MNSGAKQNKQAKISFFNEFGSLDKDFDACVGGVTLISISKKQ